MLELASEASDADAVAEAERSVSQLRDRVEAAELERMLSGEHDAKDAIVSINAGAGGTDSQDWAEMLLRMYRRWADEHGFSVELDAVTYGQEAGILSADFIVRGRYAFGMLRAERGTHRLVRISPFDNNARRQTAFAGLTVVPFIEDDGEVEIIEKDLRIDVYRSQGAGGQHVNTTDSAVRITHVPSGIVVSCQVERSQIQNRERAMQMLRAKLADRARQERDEELNRLAGEKKKVEWGSQIRSYVLQPYQMVKDERTGHQTSSVEAVLDGDVQDFIDAYLQWQRAEAATNA